jgi:predicted alpha/beta hydrolase
MEGRSGVDPLFLQVKQAGPSVYEPYTGPSRHDSHGARVISGKRLLQSATDIFVGWGAMDGKDYYVRQFRDMKIIPTTALIAPRLAEFATACGETLARAHARTGDPVAIAGYLGKGAKFTAAISQFADKYADQNERDHAQLVRAVESGDIESQPA